MATNRLVKCRECGSPVARDAPTCPQCGTPKPSQGRSDRAIVKGSSMLVRLIIAVILLIIFGPMLLDMIMTGMEGVADK